MSYYFEGDERTYNWLDEKLPCDVSVAHLRFRRGVTAREAVEAIGRMIQYEKDEPGYYETQSDKNTKLIDRIRYAQREILSDFDREARRIQKARKAK